MRAEENGGDDAVQPAQEGRTPCGFCEGGERLVSRWNGRALYNEQSYEQCPYCNGTGWSDAD